MSYRFRDVYDHVVRVTEETLLFQDRVTGILEVHLAAVSNRLNQVMKVLTVMSTIFLPLTVLTGMWGMNVPLPHFPGGPEVQFWWVAGMMVVAVSGDAGGVQAESLVVGRTECTIHNSQFTSQTRNCSSGLFVTCELCIVNFEPRH